MSECGSKMNLKRALGALKDLPDSESDGGELNDSSLSECKSNTDDECGSKSKKRLTNTSVSNSSEEVTVEGKK